MLTRFYNLEATMFSKDLYRKPELKLTPSFRSVAAKVAINKRSTKQLYIHNNKNNLSSMSGDISFMSFYLLIIPRPGIKQCFCLTSV